VPKRIAPFLAAAACVGAVVYVERAPEQPLALQPGPDAPEYASAADAIAHDKGFYTYLHGGIRQPPRYPPGYPMALAPFASFGSYPHDVERGAKLWAMFYVLIAVLAAWVLGGPLAAVLAALLVAISPFAHDAAGLVLSDAFVAALTVLMLPLIRLSNRAGDRLAGAATGLATIARVTAGINLLAMLAAMPRRSYKSLLLFAIPWLVGLGLLQWVMFGSPLTTGYDYWGVSAHFFSLSYITGSSVVREGPFIFPDRLNGDLVSFVCPCQVGGPQASLPNLTFYPLVLTGIFWIFSPPLIPLLGVAYAWRTRRDPVGRYALLLVAANLALFEIYQFQAARFIAGPATVLLVLACVWLAQVCERVWRAGRGARASPAT
jgi:4-amino-4-deoxy-L-arabinose transferase-like glycosyltransferase